MGFSSQGEGRRGRPFLIFGGFLAGTLAGGWLGLVAAVVFGLASSEPPRFPGEDLVSAVLAGGVLVALCALVYRIEGRGVRNDLLFVAAFAAFVVLYFVESSGAVAPLALSPALLVSLLFALAAIRRSPLLRLAGLSLGTLYALAGVLLSLIKSL